MSDITILDDEQQSKETKKSKFNFDFLKWDYWDSSWWSLIDRINQVLFSLQSLKTKDKVVFYRLLSTMINSWISISKALSILEKQEKKETVLKFILKKMQIGIKSWKWLSECMSEFPKSFWNAEIWMVESWEKTWKLNTSLSDLANQVEKLASINWKLKSALMYPAMVVLVVIWVVSVMMIMVVPKLLEIFDTWDNLPASTVLLISISDFFVNYWLLMIILTIWWIIFVKIWKKTPHWKYNFDKFLLNIPIFGMITRKIILSKFSRVLSWMLSSWVSIVESLRITSEAVWNEVYRQRILLVRDDIKKWQKIYESIEWDELFPEMLQSMIQIWEQTAKLDKIILKIADFYDEEIDNTVSVINKLLEPIIIVFMAVIVWFIAVAIMQPIMNLADTVSNS